MNFDNQDFMMIDDQFFKIFGRLQAGHEGEHHVSERIERAREET